MFLARSIPVVSWIGSIRAGGGERSWTLARRCRCSRIRRDRGANIDGTPITPRQTRQLAAAPATAHRAGSGPRGPASATRQGMDSTSLLPLQKNFIAGMRDDGAASSEQHSRHCDRPARRGYGQRDDGTVSMRKSWCREAIRCAAADGEPSLRGLQGNVGRQIQLELGPRWHHPARKRHREEAGPIDGTRPAVAGAGQVDTSTPTAARWCPPSLRRSSRRLIDRARCPRRHSPRTVWGVTREWSPISLPWRRVSTKQQRVSASSHSPPPFASPRVKPPATKSRCRDRTPREDHRVAAAAPASRDGTPVAAGRRPHPAPDPVLVFGRGQPVEVEDHIPLRVRLGDTPRGVVRAPQPAWILSVLPGCCRDIRRVSGRRGCCRGGRGWPPAHRGPRQRHWAVPNHVHRGFVLLFDKRQRTPSIDVFEPEIADRRQGPRWSGRLSRGIVELIRLRGTSGGVVAAAAHKCRFRGPQKEYFAPICCGPVSWRGAKCRGVCRHPFAASAAFILLEPGDISAMFEPNSIRCSIGGHCSGRRWRRDCWRLAYR